MDGIGPQEILFRFATQDLAFDVFDGLEMKFSVVIFGPITGKMGSQRFACLHGLIMLS